MKGDFSRDTFDPDKRFLRVLMQQGRVQLDADWNEQVAILLDYLQTLASDLIGPHGGTQDAMKLSLLNDDGAQANTVSEIHSIRFGRGNYYVNGRRCGYPEGKDYQPNEIPGATSWEPNSAHLFYLDVWERHVTHLEDDDIREKALNGPDTTTRSKLICRIGTQKTVKTAEELSVYETFLRELGSSKLSASGTGTGRLVAHLRELPGDLGAPCAVASKSRYRGLENQLYRVEIHSPGFDASAPGDVAKATWKWSRDNGAVAFPVRRITADSPANLTIAELEHMGIDPRFQLSTNDWVELVDDQSALAFDVRPLLQVKDVRQNEMKVILTGVAEGLDAMERRILRRWDHGSKYRNASLAKGVLPVQEGTDVELEDGVMVRFQPPADQMSASYYQSGDYWLIPARVATGDIEWPSSVGGPAALPPRGVQHFYAPLALSSIDGNSGVTVTDLRKPMP